jgi:site-specific DNA-methyltransferase (adenine-specific)
MTSWSELTTDADAVRVFHGDSRDVLKTFPDNHFDSVVCDPPYALVSITKRFGAEGAAPAQVGASGAYARASAGFMGQKWDTGETAFAVTFWAEVMRVLKPGGHVIAFSGTRTYHRLAVAIEDAGFEIRDMVAWIYGSGFPKSHDVSKGIDKAAGAEREVIGDSPFAARKPNGSAGVNSVGLSDAPGSVVTAPATDAARQWQGWGTALKPALEPIVLARKPLCGTVAGNVLQHGTGALNIDASRIGTEGGTAKAAPVKDSATVNAYGNGLNGGGVRALDAGRWPANVIHDGSEEVTGAFPDTGVGQVGGNNDPNGSMGYHGGAGGVSLPGVKDGGGSAARYFYSAKADAEDRLGSKHPTVKPVDLMAYLVRLVTPPGGLTLDPFAGSGSTGLGAMREGMRCVLIEREDAYVGDIMRKLAWAKGEGRLTALEVARLDTPEKQAAASGAGLPLFGDA